MHRAFSNFAHQLFYVGRLDAACGEPLGASDVRMRHGSTWIGFEGKRFGHPAFAKAANERVVVALRGMRKAMEQPVHALEDRARASEAAARKKRRTYAGLRSPAWMQPLGPRALGQIFNDAARKTRCDAERVDNLFGIEAKCSADTSGRAHNAENGGRMEPGLVHGLRHHGAQAAHDFRTNRNAEHGGRAVRPVPFASRQDRWHDDRAGMDGPTFEGVVEVLAVRGGAIDEGRARGAESTRMADGGAGTLIVAPAKCGLDVVLVASGHAEAGDVDQQILAFLPHG